MDTGSSKSGEGAGCGQVRRRKLVVDPRFQWKYTSLIVLIGAGLAAVMSALLYRAHYANSRILAIDPVYAADVRLSNQVFLFYLVVCVCILAAALGSWGILLTHRISGPLYVVRGYLAAIRNGRYPSMRATRRKDDLKAFFSDFAATVDALRVRDERTLADLSAVHEDLVHLDFGDAAGAKRVVAGVLSRLAESRARMESALGTREKDRSGMTGMGLPPAAPPPVAR